MLWIGAACFHVGILLLFVGHMGVFVDTLSFMEKLGIPAETSYTIGVVAGIVVGLALLFYVSRRIIVTKAKEISSFADHFWLWFLIAVVGVGIYARIFHEVSSEAVREFATNLITFNMILPPQNLWFLIHTLLAELFIIYSVIGKPIHLVGQLFTQYILVSEE
ncbi:MAG: respiratory nitrate reductase subunit gamma [Dehalococcoidales bacterium]